jgi:ABC-2 type transport system ATP-binding protein
MIEIENLAKKYDGMTALDGFSLGVGSGELFGLVGPNGAGKTTLIKILATLLRPTSGRASIAGIDVVASPYSTRSVIGYMPDVPGVYSDMQVHEFLSFFAEAFHLKGQQKLAAVDRAIKVSGLSDRRSAYVEQLSLGLKQRLVLAKTLLHDPKVLLLDEPATGLDPLARIELRGLLKRLNQEGVTILLSSHILADLEDICTRVAFIQSGRSAADAEGRTVISLGSVATSVMSCEVETVGPAAAAVPVAKQFPGARLLDTRETTFRVEIEGGPERAAAFLNHLVSSGIAVLRFDPHGPDLEARYRTVFERKPS